PGAGGVEEVAVSRHLVGPLEPPAEGAPPLVVKERRAAAAPRQAPLLEAEDEDDVELARARAHEVEHRDLARLARRRAAHRRALERADENLGRHLLLERRELLEQAERGVVGTQVVARL